MFGNKTKTPRCDFAICINAILTSSLKDRNVFSRSLSSCVKKGGHIVLVVPSLESYLLPALLEQWKIDRNVLAKKLSGKRTLLKWKKYKTRKLWI